MGSDEYELLRAVLADRPIAFHPMLARTFGGVNEALLFQQLAYWSNKGDDPDWIYKTRDDLTEETTLNRYQQEQARKKLRSLGVVEEELRGLPARVHFRIVWERVFELLGVHRAVGRPSTSKLADGRPTGRRKSTSKLGEGEPTSKSTTKRTKEDRPENFEISKEPDPEKFREAFEGTRFDKRSAD